MIKVRKLWKIETKPYPHKHGDVVYTSHISKWYDNVKIEYLYSTELDCLLDAVTEPEYSGLKVYRHQVVSEMYRRETRGWWMYDFKLNMGVSYHVYSKDELIKEGNPLAESGKFEEKFDYTTHYYVEAYLQ